MTTMTSAPQSGLDLRLARVSRDVRANALAKAMGVTPGTVTRIEQARSVDADRAQRYLNALATFPTVATVESAA